MAAKPYYGAGSYIRTEEASKEDSEGRRRKVGTRRTVDYGCTNAKWLLDRFCQRSAYDEKPMRPGLNEVINVHSAQSPLMLDAPSCCLQDKSFKFSHNQICAYIDQQDQASCQCCQGISCFPMKFWEIVDARRTTTSDRIKQRGVYSVERDDVQLWNNSSSSRWCSTVFKMVRKRRLAIIWRHNRNCKILATKYEQRQSAECP